MAGDSSESRFKFHDQAQMESLYNAFDPNLISSIKSGELSDEERKKLLDTAYNLPLFNENPNYSISESEFRKRVDDLRYKFDQFSAPRIAQKNAVQSIQKNFQDRPGVSQTRSSLLTDGGKMVVGANGGTLITSGG